MTRPAATLPPCWARRPMRCITTICIWTWGAMARPARHGCVSSRQGQSGPLTRPKRVDLSPRGRGEGRPLAAVEGQHGLDILAVGAAFGAIRGGGRNVGLDLLIGLGGARGIEADAGLEALAIIAH